MYRRLREEDVRTIMRIVTAEGNKFPEITRFYYEEFLSKIIFILEKIVTRAVQRGELRDNAATRLPLVLIAPGILGAIWQMTFAPYRKISLDVFLDAHIDLVMNGICKPSNPQEQEKNECPD